MFYLLLPLAVALFLTADSEAHKPEVHRVFFENHSYISFDNKCYLHDPDCGCDHEWILYSIPDSQNWLIYKLPINAYD